MIDPPSRPITLFLAGDVMTGRGIDQILPYPGQPEIFEPCLRSATDYIALAEAARGPIERATHFTDPWGDALAILDQCAPDARIINLETAVTRRGRPWPGKDIHYRMHPENLPCLTGAKVDLCTLANNHVLDWGRTGLIETLDQLHRHGIRTAGAGRNAHEAWQPAVLDRPDAGRIVVFAIGCPSSGIPPEWAARDDTPGIARLADLSVQTLEDIGEHLDRCRKPGDTIIVSIHWGGNWGDAIPESHRAFAHGLIDRAGVTVVHGHSSHHPLGFEIYRDRPIFYGCGDLLNDYEGIRGFERYRPDLALLYLVRLTDTGLQHLELAPLHRSGFRLHGAKREQAEWLRQKLTQNSLGLRGPLGIDGQGHLHWYPTHDTSELL